MIDLDVPDQPFIFGTYLDERVVFDGTEFLGSCIFERCDLVLRDEQTAPRTSACCFVDCRFLYEDRNVGPMWERTPGGQAWQQRERANLSGLLSQCLQTPSPMTAISD